MPHMPFADIIGGALLPALLSIAYVHRARRHGTGAVIDASIADAMALMPSTLISDLLAGQPIEPRGHTMMGGALACYGVYAAADGHVALGALEERFWINFCKIAGIEEAHHHDHHAPERQPLLRRLVSAFFASRTRADLASLFADVDACVTPVLSYEEMLQTPQANARQYVSGATNGPLPILAFPALVDGMRLCAERGAPAQGEHSDEIRAEAFALLRKQGR
jgi:crotonobetainyl-CoA:carnitine CoA-transferase CaiB-like acyl-CoA transferase